MKMYMKRLLSLILVITMVLTNTYTGFAETASRERMSAGDAFSVEGDAFSAEKETTWAEAGRQIAGMLGYIVEDAANIDLNVYSGRIANLSLEDDSIYLAILAEEGYLPEEPSRIDPDAVITMDEYVQWMEIAFPKTADSQAAIDSLQGETEWGNIAIMGDDLSVNAIMPERLAVTAAQQLSLTAVKASALTLNAASSVDLSECEISRVHISDTALEEEQPGEEAEADIETEADEEAETEEETEPGEEADPDEETDEESEPDLIYLHMDEETQLPEIIVKSADEVIIEGSGALGVIRVQEAVGTLTVRATASVINETEEAFEVTGPDAEVVELQPGEQVDFVLTKWLVSFVTEGTPVETQEIAPGGMVDFEKATTTLAGKVFTAWYEDADYTTPTSHLATVDRQMTLYARFVDEADAVVVTFETFGGLELEPLTFAKGEYLLTKPVQKLYTYKEDYSFGGWCMDEECTTGFGYTDPIEESMTLYAYFASNEEVMEEKHDTATSIELPDGSATIGLILPEGMSADDALGNLSVEAGTGGETPEIAVRETEDGAEIYCEAGFTPGCSFTLTAQNGVQFAGQPEYIDTLTVSIFREESKIVEFSEGLTYVLWDNVTDYTPVTKTEVDSESTPSTDIEINNMLEDYDSQSTLVPGSLVLTGDVDLQPGQIVVFYDGDLGWDEDNVMYWESGDLAGYALYAQIDTVEARPDGARDVTFHYANPEDYLSDLDVHTTETVNLSEELTDAQLAQAEKSIATQLTSNEELQAQMLVAVMTSSDTQKFLDDTYGEGIYSLAAAKAYLTHIDADPVLTTEGDTLIASIDVSCTIKLISEQGVLAVLTPRMFFEERLTLDIDVNGDWLWMDASLEFGTKTTIRLELSATTGDDLYYIGMARETLEEVVTAAGTAVEDYDYNRAAQRLSICMSQLVDADLDYQDLFAIQLLNIKKRFCYGLITVGGKLELMGQAACIATFGVTVTAEYRTRMGFHFNFKKMKGSDYKEKLASDVTSQIDLIGKLGVRMGVAVTFYFGLTVVATDKFTGSFYAYVELAGMFLHKAALSAGGGNYAGAVYLEIGVDFDFDMGFELNFLLFSFDISATFWNYRWNLYSLHRGMTMSIVQKDPLNEMWDMAMQNVDGRTSYIFEYLPIISYDMYTGERSDRQLLFETLQSGNVTAKFTMENVYINGEAVSADDPRVDVIYAGDGVKGKAGVIYADEMAAAANKVTLYDCDVVLTYENKNGSELIKHHRQVFHLTREFKMATITVNVNFALYDWCAHAWGIEAAEWDGESLYKFTFENTHVLGCPVEPTATRGVSLDTFVSAAKSRYPEMESMTLSWFNPTRNDVNLTTQLSVPGFSDTCYLTPKSSTLRYSLYSTSLEYDLNFYLYVKRFDSYTGEITYIIEAPDAEDDAVFTVRGADDGHTMTFERMEGTNPKRWSLTVPRASFDGTEQPIRLGTSRGDSVPTDLIVTGREAENVVTLYLSGATRKVDIILGEGVTGWDTITHDISDMSAITPGDQVTIWVDLAGGYSGVRAVTDPEGVKYSYKSITSKMCTFTFTMPFSDLKLTLYGTKSYNVDFMYNYSDKGLFTSRSVVRNTAVAKPSTPFVDGLVFAGWYDNPECEGEPFDFSQKITKDTTLYAGWKVKVTVDLGGAKGQAAYVTGRRYEEVDVGEEGEEGKETEDIKYIEIVDTELIFPGDTSNYTRYTYTTHMLGDTALEYALPAYEGHEFTGWYTNPYCSGEPVKPEEYVLTGSVTFYAGWKEIAIITYEINDGGDNKEPYDMSLEYVGTKLSHIPEDPKREHYTFTGWYRTANTAGKRNVDLTSFIPEDSMSLYAGWKPVDYAITYELNGGVNHKSNPASYNADSAEIVLYNPTRPGYVFAGWTGTDLTGPTLEATIPFGNGGDRSYTAHWRPAKDVDDILEAALDAIGDPFVMSVNDYSEIADFHAAAMEKIAADETCASYIDRLGLEAEIIGDVDEDDAALSWPVKVTVSYTEDDGSTISQSRRITLRVEKNPVTLDVAPVYTVGGSYIAYGTALENVELTGTATWNGVEVQGSFAWADATLVPLSADNGREIYRVVFTPDDPHTYIPAEVLIAVNTQTGVKLGLALPETVGYTGRTLDISECTFYVENAATGEKLDAAVTVNGAVLRQSSFEPGVASVALESYETLAISGFTGNDLYALIDAAPSANVTITLATPVIVGDLEYDAEYDALLYDVVYNLRAETADGDALKGSFAWVNPATRLSEVGAQTFQLRFTPEDLNHYSVVTVDVKVNVSGYPGKITYILDVTDAPDDVTFTVRADNGSVRTLTFEPVEGETNRWSLTVNRAAFDEKPHAILFSRSGVDAVESGLTVTGREAEDVVTLTLNSVPRKVEIAGGEGVASWDTVSHDLDALQTVVPGERVTISVELEDGYENVRATTEPEGLQYTYTPVTGMFSFVMPYSDLKLTLYGTKNYKVDFMYNCSGLGLFTSVDVEEDTAVQKPSDPIADGLVFVGWYDNSDCTGEPFDFTRPITQNTTLYAGWKVKVTVDLGGAEGQAAYITGRRYVGGADGKTLELTDTELIFPGDETKYPRYTYAAQMLGENALEYVLPNNPDCEFVGWYTSPDFAGEAVDPTNYVLTGSVTFYARWKRTAVLTYDLNNGEADSTYGMSMEYVGMPLSHIPEDPERDSYRFLGWFRTPAANAQDRVELESYIAEGAMTLYAGWMPEEYFITYELNGGENDPANPASYNYENGEIVIGNPTRTGYAFLGWTAEGVEAVDGAVRIPAGHKGDITLTANWEIIRYALKCYAVNGTLPASVPDTYTVEDGDIALGNPTRTGYIFTGWTGTDLTEPILDVVVPAGSTGDRSYTAHWKFNNNTPSDILQAALNAISNPFVMNAKDYDSVADFQAAARAKVAADETCAPYIDQLSLTAELTGNVTEDNAAYTWPAKVTVTFTEDDGNVVSRNKSVTLRVEKNLATLDVHPEYTKGGRFIAYDTSLKDVNLIGAATFEGETVQGRFAWADEDIVPVSADNDQAIYRVVFTPEDRSTYSVAEALIAVNTQTGVNIAIELSDDVLSGEDTIEYMGRDLLESEYNLYAVDAVTGGRFDAPVNLTGAQFSQTNNEPGVASIGLDGYDTIEISGVTDDPDQYVLIDKTPRVIFVIARATPVIKRDGVTVVSGELTYEGEYDQLLYDVEHGLQAYTAAGVALNGRFDWVNSTTRLDAGDNACQLRFIPDDLSHYRSVTIDATVHVDGEPGQVTYILTVDGLTDTDRPDELVFTVEADNGSVKTLTFKPVEGSQSQWSLTADRAAFADDTVHPIMLQRGEGKAVECGLDEEKQPVTVTGRENEDEVTKNLVYMPRTLTVNLVEGIVSDTFGVIDVENTPLNLGAVKPGEEVIICAEPEDGYNNVSVSVEKPAKLNYWFVDKAYIHFIMPNENVTINLNGTTVHHVTFHYGNDKGVYDCIEVEHNQASGDLWPANPTLDGMTFLGWIESGEYNPDGYNYYTADTTITENIDLEADWKVRITVDFGGQKAAARYVDNNGGDGLEMKYFLKKEDGSDDTSEKSRFSFDWSSTRALPDFVPPQDVKGYEFKGWYLTPDCSDDSEYSMASSWFWPSESMTLYAGWEKTAKVTFVMPNGVPVEYEETIGEPIDLLHWETPTLSDGYAFGGWYLTPACLDEEDKVEQESYIVEGDVTLYPRVELLEYKITYNLNGGVNDPANPDSYTVEDETITILPPTREGYDLAGYEMTGPVEDIDTNPITWQILGGSTGDATLTVNWKPVDYAISYDLVGGTATGSNPATYNVDSADITLNNPTRSGYTFAGWTGTDLAEASDSVVIPAGSMGARSYAANWKLATPVEDILAAAKSHVMDQLTLEMDDVDNDPAKLNAAYIEALLRSALAADETCKPYLDLGLLQLQVELTEALSAGDTCHTGAAKITVSFADDLGNAGSFVQEDVALQLNKRSLTLSAEVDYTDALLGSYYNPDGMHNRDELNVKFFPWGTELGTVKLTADSKAVDSDGNVVSGTFAWADPSAKLQGKDNDVARVLVFTPTDTQTYSTAETKLYVRAQIRILFTLSLNGEYRGRKYIESDYKWSGIVEDLYKFLYYQCVNSRNDVIEQDSYMPGTAHITITHGDLVYNVPRYKNNNAYYVDSSPYKVTKEIVPATVRISGPLEYDVSVGTSLYDVAHELTANTSWESDLEGTFRWSVPDTRLNTMGTYRYEISFTADRPDLYNCEYAKAVVTLNVVKQTAQLPEITPVTYDGKHHAPSLDDTAYYTVESNEGGTNAGDYEVVLKLRNPWQCVWSDGDTNATKKLTFTIQPAKLKVSGKATVQELTYGQQMTNDTSSVGEKMICASAMIKGLTVTGLSNATVTGKWVWDDANYTLKRLDVDTYTVHAVFRPDATYGNNYETVGMDFSVTVIRATPSDAGMSFKVAEGALYMPSDKYPVSILGEYTPAIASGSFTNPKDGSTVSGTLSWEEPKRLPEATETKATAVFTPDDTKNYSTKSVQVPLTYSDYVSVFFSSNVPFLYWGYETTWFSRNYRPEATSGLSTLWFMTLSNHLGSRLAIEGIRVYAQIAGEYKLQLETHYDKVHKSTNEYWGGWGTGYNNTLATITPMGFKEDADSYTYTIKLPGDRMRAWNRHNLKIEVTFGTISYESPTSTWGDIDAFNSGYSLSSATLAASGEEETLEPGMESTSIPEPGTIGNVVKIEPKQDAEKSGDVWKIQLEKDQKKAAFQWEVSEPASQYLVYAQKQDGQDKPELIGMPAERKIELDVSDYADGRYKIYVGAVLEDGSVSWGEAQFELIAFVESTTEAATEPATEAATEQSTEAATEPATEAATEPATEAATEPATEAATEPATEAATEPATEAATEPATEAATEPATEAVQEPAPKQAPETAPEPVQEAPAAEEAG